MDAQTVTQRIRAARTLRGLEQAGLDALFAADGLGKQEASRLERGELPLTAARRHALVRHLRVPEEWFTEDDVDQVVGTTIDPSVGTGTFLAQALEQVQQKVEALEQGQAEIIGLLTGQPAARASLNDMVVRIIEDAMTQRGEKVGLRGRQPPQPRQGEASSHAA